jgi:leucyl aminopeptidase
MKDELIKPDKGQAAIAIHLVNKDGFEAFAKGLSGPQRAALAGQKFNGGGYQVGIVPDGEGWFVVGGVKDPAALSSWCLAKLAGELPAGTYRLAGGEPGAALHGWQTAQYAFTRYREEKDAQGPRVLLTKDAKAIEPAIAEAQAVALVRDLVNTPAEDMGPAELEAEAEKLAKTHGAKLAVTKGEALEREYPMVHAVGRAAARTHAPRLLHLTWGDEKAPVLAIVGKGVCFDSGGLDIKPASGMLLMKKDMGGAAHALALAGLVMGAGLKVRLHCLVPAVENAIAGNAFRPGDVLKSRKGLTVEIGNTDAEGRLILGDALTRASEESPELIIDFATLTGAARVAVGPDLPPCSRAATRPPRRCSPPARRTTIRAGGCRSTSPTPNGSSPTSPTPTTRTATVLPARASRRCSSTSSWVRTSTGGTSTRSPGVPPPSPGRPKGGDALGLRAAWHMLRERFG